MTIEALIWVLVGMFLLRGLLEKARNKPFEEWRKRHEHSS